MSQDVTIPDGPIRHLVLPTARPERLLTGNLRAEGPVRHTAGEFLLGSGILRGRTYQWVPDPGVRAFSCDSRHANGQTMDAEGRRIACGHLTRAVIRYDHADEREALADSIHQHSDLAPMMTVKDNITMDRQPTRLGWTNRKRQQRDAVGHLARYGIDPDPDTDTVVGSLPTLKQKEVEIATALAPEAKVPLMDAPAGWLAASEGRRMHDTIRLRNPKGVGILSISHMLDEIFAIVDSVTMLRDGQIIAGSAIDRITRTEVVAATVGEWPAQESLAATGTDRKSAASGPVRLSVQGPGRKGVFRDISLDLQAGENLCVTGPIGSKRTGRVQAPGLLIGIANGLLVAGPGLPAIIVTRGTHSIVGAGSAVRTLLGALFLGILNNGMNIRNVSFDLRLIARGIIMALALSPASHRAG